MAIAPVAPAKVRARAGFFSRFFHYNPLHIMTTIKTTLDGFGPVTATGTIMQNPDWPDQGEPKMCVLNLTVKNFAGTDITTELSDDEQEQIECELIEDFQGEAGRYQDYLIDAQIQRGREYARYTYS